MARSDSSSSGSESSDSDSGSDRSDNEKAYSPSPEKGKATPPKMKTPDYLGTSPSPMATPLHQGFGHSLGQPDVTPKQKDLAQHAIMEDGPCINDKDGNMTDVSRKYLPSDETPLPQEAHSLDHYSFCDTLGSPNSVDGVKDGMKLSDVEETTEKINELLKKIPGTKELETRATSLATKDRSKKRPKPYSMRGKVKNKEKTSLEELRQLQAEMYDPIPELTQAMANLTLELETRATSLATKNRSKKRPKPYSMRGKVKNKEKTSLEELRQLQAEMYDPIPELTQTKANLTLEDCGNKNGRRRHSSGITEQTKHAEMSKIINSIDLEEIKDGKPLWDKHINAAQGLLKLQFPKINGLRNPVTLSAFHEVSTPYIQILHVDGCHWVTIHSADQKGPVMVFDSNRPSQLSERTIELIKNYHGNDLSYHNIVLRKNKKQQQGSVDCGLFAIAFATSLCLRDDPTFQDYNEQKMRQHLLKCLENNKMTPFPLENDGRFSRTVQPVVLRE